MANEISVTYPGAATLYAILRDSATGYAWNGSAFEAWSDDNIGDYDIALTSAGGDFYQASIPSGITAGTVLRVSIYKQSGESPSVSDIIVTSWKETYGSASSSSSSGTELSASDLISKISDIDTQIATLVASSSGGADVVELDLELKGSSRVKSLIDLRKMYQDLLDTYPHAEGFYFQDGSYDNP